MKYLISIILLLASVIGLSPRSSFARGADDGKLRTLRLALSTNGEYAAYFGGTKAAALAGMVNTLTRVNGVFEKDFGLKLILIPGNDAIIYTDPLTDPYSIKSNWRTEVQSNFTSVIGEANYDIGHLLAGNGGGGDAGCLGCIGVDGIKGSAYTSTLSGGAPEGDAFDIGYVAHEMGHQLGAQHTYTHVTENSGVQMEPGGGSTIMGYVGFTIKDVQPQADPYFHAISILQVTNNLKSKTCPAVISTGNFVPVVNAGSDYTIPKGTPFMLTGSASDGNADDVLTYSWEQMNAGSATTSTPSSTATSGPIFRSYLPSLSPVRYFPKMETVLAGLTTTQGTDIPVEVLPSVARTLKFYLTVRDNRAGGSANNADEVLLTVDGNSGPFTVDSQNSPASYAAGTTQVINWAVAGTDANGVNCTAVDILLSKDGGKTFPITLISGTPNDGSASVVIPNIPGTTNRIMVKGMNQIFFDVNNADFAITASGSSGDTTAPSVSTLSASGTTTVSTNLSWTAATDNVGVVGYDVYQNGALKSSVSGTTFAVSGLSASTTYSFYVKAKDAAGSRSAASNTVSVTTLAPAPSPTPSPTPTADTSAPSAPSLSASGATTSSMNLSWSGATDNVGVTGYDVYQNGVLKTSTASTSLAVSGLSSSTSYSFYVKAKDAAGNRSAASNTVSVTTLTPADITAPSAPTLTASGATSSSTNLYWSGATDAVGVTGYDIYQNGVLRNSSSGTNASITGLSASTTYSFYVIAKDAAGNRSPASNTVSIMTLAPVVTTSSLTVALTVPATVARRATATFSATASVTSGTISRVEFYVAGALVCTDSTAAYSCSWKAPGSAKTVTVEARAFDSMGAQKSAFQTMQVTR